MIFLHLLLAFLATAPIAISTTGYYAGYEPATVRVRVTLDPHPDNRILCVAYDGTGDAGSSCWDVDGSAPRTTWKEFRSLAAGEYTVMAQVTRAGGKVYSASAQFIVSSRRG